MEAIDLSFLAKYPVRPLPVLGAFDSLNPPERLVERAVERLREAVESMTVSVRLGDPLVEYGSHALSIAVVAKAGDRWIDERYALAESLRFFRLVQREAVEVVKRLGDLMGFRLEDADLTGRIAGRYPLRVGLVDYLKAVAGTRLSENPRYKLGNRVVVMGWVYVGLEEARRLLSARFYQMVRDRVERAREDVDVKRLKLHPRLMETASWLRSYSAQARGRASLKASKATPPCMEALLSSLRSGVNLGHPARFALAAWMLRTGRGVDEVVDVFRASPDFDEGVTRYQVEHIGKGGYRVPSCGWMRTHGLCIEEGRRCPEGIGSPLGYRRDVGGKR